jgi:hypothetical protein
MTTSNLFKISLVIVNILAIILTYLSAQIILAIILKHIRRRIKISAPFPKPICTTALPSNSFKPKQVVIAQKFTASN